MRPADPAISLAPRRPDLERQFSRRIEVREAEAGLRRGVRNPLPLAFAFWAGVGLLLGAGLLFDLARGVVVWWGWR